MSPTGSMVCTKRACLDRPCPADVCKGATKCGGTTGALCRSRTQVCIGNPADDCNPDEGGADCIGCRVLDQCLRTECKDGYVCELNWYQKGVMA
ncbi:hypothetical protein DIPPA_09103 [Diplonema papillatum]|nr:hypothetical protein DIPPA_09103 [Diplonema papillatum]